MHSVCQFVSSMCCLSKNLMSFKTLCGKFLHETDSVHCSDNSKIILFFQLKGEGRKRKGETHHPEKSCGPCIVCNKTSFRYYFHLVDRSDDTQLIDFFKAKKEDISDFDCICNTREERFKSQCNYKYIPKNNGSDTFRDINQSRTNGPINAHLTIAQV